MFWFGTPLSIFSLSLLGGEISEVIESAISTFPSSLYHICVICLCYGGLMYLYVRIKPNYKLRFYTYGGGYLALALMIVLLSILPYKALYKTPRLNNFMPRNDSISLMNSLKVFSAYFFIYLRQDNMKITTYPPYNVEKFSVTPRNVVLVLGESVNANHIALLGYERNTTPLLLELMQEDSNFVAKKAISSSVLTRVSLPMLFNVAYEYNNILHITNEQTHLFKLAKEAGFKTYYISDQSDAEATAMAPNYIDVLRTKESYPFRAGEVGDMILLEELDKHLDSIISDNKKGISNFIVLHQRNPHSPYEYGYRGYKEASIFPINNVSKEEGRINSYDNAMIFNDYIISSIFKKFRTIKQVPNYVIFVPDHGEAMGEIGANGVREWGHAFLSSNVANIPFFASLYNGQDAAYMQRIKGFNNPTHYEIGVLLGEIMGYKISSAVFKKDVFYVNGVSISGDSGYLIVHKNNDSVSFEIGE